MVLVLLVKQWMCAIPSCVYNESDFVEMNRVFCVGFELASVTYTMFSIQWDKTCFFFQPIKSKAKANTWLGANAFSRLDSSCVAYSLSPDWSTTFFTTLIVFCVISRPKQRSEPPCCGLSLNRERKRFWKELIRRGKTSWKRFEKLKIKMFFFS